MSRSSSPKWCELAAAALLGGACAAPAAGPHGWPLVYRQDFERAGAERDFVTTDARAWRRSTSADGAFLEQFAACEYAPRFRSPLNLALLATPALGDFALEARLMQTGREYAHRDMCFVFGFRDAEHFGYAHLASQADDSAHQVHVVDGADRRAVTSARSPGVDWGRGEWRTLRVVRRGASLRVWLGDAPEPQLEATDTVAGAGWIGFGTFDDTGAVDDVRVWSPDARAELCPGFAAPAERPSFAFTHDDSVVQRWPFGLDEPTTKIVAEPASAAEVNESYWVVRSSAPFAGELAAELLVRPEFPLTAFEPLRGRDYDLVLGTDRNGATTTESGPGCLTIRVPRSAGPRPTGFVLRARFPGDGDEREPPRSLLVELVRVVDVASGRELPLGSLRRARWLIVDAEPTGHGVRPGPR